MEDQPELPAEVVAQIQANRKVSAIKLLRASRGIGLKEAKELVDAYIDSNPPSVTKRSSNSRSGDRGLVYIAMIIIIAYALYRYFF